MKATWNGVVLAESDKTIVVEGNYYFPPDSTVRVYFRGSDKHTTCHWKGVASYYDVAVNSEVNRGAAWYYPVSRPEAARIKDYVTFWKGVQVK